MLKPVYTVCPKPGELYRTVTYLLTEQKAEADTGESNDAELHEYEPHPKSNPWRPVYSSLAFMIVILGSRIPTRQRSRPGR